MLKTALIFLLFIGGVVLAIAIVSALLTRLTDWWFRISEENALTKLCDQLETELPQTERQKCCGYENCECDMVPPHIRAQIQKAEQDWQDALAAGRKAAEK